MWSVFRMTYETTSQMKSLENSPPSSYHKKSQSLDAAAISASFTDSKKKSYAHNEKLVSLPMSF